MDNKCDICGNEGSFMQRLTDPFMIEIGNVMGVDATDLFCELCFNMLKDRCDQLRGFQSFRQSLTVNSTDGNLPLTQESEPIPRLSEMSLDISRPTSSKNSRSSALTTPRRGIHSESLMTEDSVDRLVNKKSRINPKKVSALPSQSLSFDNSSQSFAKRSNLQKSMERVQNPETLTDESRSSIQSTAAPMPKDRPMRKGVQWATGRFSPPLSIGAKILSTDMPRVHSG